MNGITVNIAAFLKSPIRADLQRSGSLVSYV